MINILNTLSVFHEKLKQANPSVQWTDRRTDRHVDRQTMEMRFFSVNLLMQETQ